jgi:DME family drug/metabolite transporter
MAAGVTWGTTAATMALVGRRSPLGPGAVGFFRVLLAAPILLGLARLAGVLVTAPLVPHLGRLALLGAAQAGFQLGYFGAVPRIGVGPTALIAICTSPLIIATLAAWWLRERVTARVAAALAGGVAGTALLVGGPLMPAGAATGVAAAGAALALGAALSYATYVVLAKSVVSHLHPFAIAGVSFGFAALFLLPAAALHGASWEALRPVWLHLTYLAVVPTAIAYALYVRGLQGTSATAAGIGSLMEPLTATLLGMAAFGESLGGKGLLGAGLLLGAVALLLAGSRPQS